jgi:hypothetical protein
MPLNHIIIIGKERDIRAGNYRRDDYFGWLAMRAIALRGISRRERKETGWMLRAMIYELYSILVWNWSRYFWMSLPDTYPSIEYADSWDVTDLAPACKCS